MARLHSRKKGKSGRSFPKRKERAPWVKSKKEVEEIIVGLAKKGYRPTEIGLILRDQYGIPDVDSVLKMSLSKFLEKERLLPEFPDDLIALIRKAVGLRKHLKSNGSDVANKVKLLHIESKIHRLAKYYRRTKRIPENWKYVPEEAALLVK